jgi:hypothetical protein
MKMTKSVVLVSMLVAITYSQMAHAWGQTGHRVTGQIAQLYLSTYADENRSNPANFWQKVAGPFHYVTVPAGKTYSEVGAPEKGDAYTAIQMYTKTLKDALSSRADKQLALKMIVHIIGDLHQPLHAGDGTDRGGNDVKVEFFWDESNLHRVWDSGLIERKQLSYTEWYEFLAPKITAEQAASWQTTDPLVYIQESVEIRDTIYPESEKLSWQYLYDHTPVMKLRLQQAGVRIAAHLNAVFE